MNKLNKTDKIDSVVSTVPYSSNGISHGKLIRTQDGWYITAVKSKFAYNNGKAYYFNILLTRDGTVYPLQSYSTHGLIKAMQKALVSKGYKINQIDGVLNIETKNAIKSFIRSYKFDSSTKITSSLLWFMSQDKTYDIVKVVQATLKKHGKNVGKIDGQIGSKTIRALKEYQKMLGVNVDGKITPELVYLLLQTSQNIDIYRQMRSTLNEPILLIDYRNRMWPNQL
jgi:peptidoglycan hydrolase-like protein with peptidoglycan-binding domain